MKSKRCRHERVWSIIAGGSFLYLLGTVGAGENGDISVSRLLVQGMIGVAMLLAGVYFGGLMD